MLTLCNFVINFAQLSQPITSVSFLDVNFIVTSAEKKGVRSLWKSPSDKRVLKIGFVVT